MDRKYKKGGDAGSKGVKFQVNLLTLFLLKATNKLKDWRLSTENNEAGKFDDVVLEYSDGAVLLQAKHKENRKTITLKELLSENTKNDDFSLPKYFLSYQEIKSKFNVKNVIICTNANYDKKVFTFLNSKKLDPDDVLYYEGDKCLFYTFNDNILPDLKNNTKIYLQQCRNKMIEESDINDENLKDFLEHLQFYFHYASEKDLENIIEKELCAMKYNNLYKEISLPDLHSKMMDWFQQKDGEYLTEAQSKAMLFEIQKEKYWQKLERYDVFFQHNNFKFDSPTNIFHMVHDEGSLLREIQIYRTLQDVKTVLCIRPDSDVEELKGILKAFELPKYTFLIIIWSKVMDQSLICEVIDKLEQIVNKKNYKKVILVTRNNRDLTTQFQLKNLSHEVVYQPVEFEDLLEETKNNVLKKRIINFQGNIVSLEELLALETTDDYKAVVNSEILEKVIKNEEIAIGSRVNSLDLSIESVYISRTFIRDDVPIEEGDIFDMNEKIILIADGAGMGKSTVLTNLATSIKKKYPHLWVINIALSDYTKFLSTMLGQNRRTLNIIELLNSHVETRLTHQFEQFFFSMNKRMVLMLDGVDEVSPNYTELVENLIIHCQQARNFRKIVVTSRPHVIEQLEDKLTVKLFKLQSFTEQNQIDFLTSYWSHNIELAKRNKEKCELYAKALLNQMWFKNNEHCMDENDFTSIPLQVRMLAEIFQERNRLESSVNWQGCKEYLEANEEIPNLPKQINYAKLFKMFVDKKRSVYLEKLNPSRNALADTSINRQFDECLGLHRSHALKVILDKHERKLFTEYKISSNSVENEVLNIGIIQKTGNKTHFIHRTFAEYFFADCLVRELQCQNQNVKFQKFLIDDVLRTHWYVVTRVFFSSALQEVLNSLPPNVFKEYRKSYFNLNADENSLYLIHDVAEMGYVAILQLIFKSIEFEIIKPCNSKEFALFPERKQLKILGKIKNIYRRYRYTNALNVLRFCVQQGGVNIINSNDETPLDLAIQAGHLDMVKFLVEQGSNVNRDRPPTCALGVPICRAVTKNHFDIVKFLTEQGAKIKPNSEWDYEILYKAISNDSTDIVRHLLDKILETDDSATRDPFVPYTAAYLGRRDILEPLLRNGVSANVRIKNGETLLFGAARGGQLDIVQYLVDRGAEINSKDDGDNTALHIVSRKPSLYLIVSLLIKLGTDINVVNSNEETALHIAIIGDNLEAVQLLIQDGADMLAKGPFVADALHNAISYGHVRIIKFLKNYGAGLNGLGYSIDSILDTAAAYGQVELIKYLLKEQHVSDADLKGLSVHRVLDMNISLLTDKLLRHNLKSYGLNDDDDDDIEISDSELFLSEAQSVCLNNIRRFIASGIDRTFPDDRENGNIALHLVVDKIYMFSNKDLIKLLVESGVDINATNGAGCTALHTLLYNSEPDCLRLVKELDIDSYDNGLETMSEAVMVKRWNANCSKKKKKRIKWKLGMFAIRLSAIIFLIKRGTDINLKDFKGNSAASLMQEKGGQLLMKYLDLRLPE